MRELHAFDEVIECDDDVDPRLRRRQRHFQFRDDAGRAISTADLLRRIATQLDDARSAFERDDAGCDDVARLAHAAEGDTADAAAAAGDETADLRRALGRWVHAQLEAVRPGYRVDII